MRVPRLAWILLAGAFLALEGLALVNAVPGDTFSDVVWDLLQAAPWLAGPLVVFLGWLAWHFVEPVLRRRSPHPHPHPSPLPEPGEGARPEGAPEDDA